MALQEKIKRKRERRGRSTTNGDSLLVLGAFLLNEK